MKFRIFLLIALVFGVVLAQANEALVTGVRGAVTLDGKAVKPATRLVKGAKLQVPAGGTVTVVYLTDSHKETLTGPGTLVVGGASQGKLEKTSGPGAIARQPTGNTKGAVGTMRDVERPDLNVEAVRINEDGKTELVFRGYSGWDGNMGLLVRTYDVDSASVGDKVVAKLDSPAGNNSEVPHAEPIPGFPADHTHRVIVLPVRLEEGVPYSLKYWDDSGPDGYIETERLITPLSAERSDALFEMQRWAYAEPLSADRLLSFAQIAYEWEDFGTALVAAYNAHNLRTRPDATEVYRKLLYLTGHEQVAKNLQ